MTKRTDDSEVLDPSILNTQRERIVRNWLLGLNPDLEFTLSYIKKNAPMGTQNGDIIVVLAAMVEEGLIVHVPSQPHGVYRLAVVEGR